MVASRHIDGVETSTVALGGSWRSDTRTTASIREPSTCGDGFVVAVLDSKALPADT